jgi:hypothetical protein
VLDLLEFEHANGTKPVMKNLSRAALLLSAGVIVLAGFTGVSAASPSSGTIVGTAQPCVGPVGVNPHHEVPFVTVSHGSHVVAEKKKLTSPYKFKFTVPAGTYRVAAPGDGTVKARVHKGKTVRVTLHSGCL